MTNFEVRQDFLSKLGSRFGSNGPHAARTMMLDDGSTLFAQLPQSASRDKYIAEVVEQNRLGNGMQ